MIDVTPLFLSHFVEFCFICDFRSRDQPIRETAETEASASFASGRVPLSHLPLQFEGQVTKRRWRPIQRDAEFCYYEIPLFFPRWKQVYALICFSLVFHRGARPRDRQVTYRRRVEIKSAVFDREIARGRDTLCTPGIRGSNFVSMIGLQSTKYHKARISIPKRFF